MAIVVEGGSVSNKSSEPRVRAMSQGEFGWWTRLIAFMAAWRTAGTLRGPRFRELYARGGGRNVKRELAREVELPDGRTIRILRLVPVDKQTSAPTNTRTMLKPEI